LYSKLLLIPMSVVAIVSVVGAHTTDNTLREDAIVKAVRRAGPAVVNISSANPVDNRQNPFFRFGMNPLFENFFKDFFDPRINRSPDRATLGSGVIIDGTKGYILTNAHVIARSGEITVILQDEREFHARVVGTDPASDLAVLQIDSDKPLPSLSMGRSDDLMIGETVIAIGNPFGFSHSVTTGVISSLHRSIRTEQRVYRNFIQTDASINPGNSGGPLLNVSGDLIGINTAIYSKAQGIGFAIPITKARRYVNDLIRFGKVLPTWLGLTVQALDPNLADYLGLATSAGIIVTGVAENSPAGKMGIRSGDVIVAIDGHRIGAVEDYLALIRDLAADQEVRVTYVRKQERKTIRLRAVVFPEDQAPGLVREILGIVVADISAEIRERYRIATRSGAVILEVTADTYIDRIGVRPGDVIRQLDGEAIETVDDLYKLLIKIRHRKTTTLLIQRGRQGYYVTLER
jgi:serine protease Do